MLPSPNPNVIVKPLASGAVLYSTEDEVYFGLNAVGVRIWDMLPPVHRELDDLCRALARDYPEVDETTIRGDVLDLLDALGAQGLVRAARPAAAVPT